MYIVAIVECAKYHWLSVIFPGITSLSDGSSTAIGTAVPLLPLDVITVVHSYVPNQVGDQKPHPFVYRLLRTKRRAHRYGRQHVLHFMSRDYMHVVMTSDNYAR